MKPTWCTFHSIYWKSKASYMFRALLVHPQEALNKRQLVYCVCIVSVGWATIAVKLTLYAWNIPNAVCAALPEDDQVMLETCRGPWFSINWMKSSSRWSHYTEVLCIILRLINKATQTVISKPPDWSFLYRIDPSFASEKIRSTKPTLHLYFSGE
jgi:hypothetical protein